MITDISLEARLRTTLSDAAASSVIPPAPPMKPDLGKVVPITTARRLPGRRRTVAAAVVAAGVAASVAVVAVGPPGSTPER